MEIIYCITEIGRNSGLERDNEHRQISEMTAEEIRENPNQPNVKDILPQFFELKTLQFQDRWFQWYPWHHHSFFFFC